MLVTWEDWTGPGDQTLREKTGKAFQGRREGKKEKKGGTWAMVGLLALGSEGLLQYMGSRDMWG